MLNKTFKVISFENSKPMLTVEFDDKKYELLSTLFFADGSTVCKVAIQKIKEIFEDKISVWEGTGNVYSIRITKETTTVCDIFDESISCNILTEDFKSLIDDWFSELSKLDT